MIIPKKILRRWERVVQDIGITAAAEGSGVNFRAFKKAMETGHCKDGTFLLVQRFIDKRTKKVKKLTAIEAQP